MVSISVRLEWNRTVSVELQMNSYLYKDQLTGKTVELCERVQLLRSKVSVPKELGRSRAGMWV